MEYVFDDDAPEAPGPARTQVRTPAHSAPGYAGALRRELSQRNIRRAEEQRHAHEVSLGSGGAVLYREDERGDHGNFHPSAYARIRKNPAWAARLNKAHTTARMILVSHDRERRELDSANSSDALLMNIFCHPQTLVPGSAVRTLMGAEDATLPEFGYRPRVPLKNGSSDATEIDMRLGRLLVEAKLTEQDFQTAPWRLVERYRDLEEVFCVEDLPRAGTRALSYQLIRGVLAAHALQDMRFCVLCDARRPDLIADWYRVQQCVRSAELRCRLALLTWQEAAGACGASLRRWLEEKYGLVAA